MIDKWGSSQLGWFSGSFILFRGTKMTQDQIDDWFKIIGSKVYFPCNVSATRNLRICLNFAKCDWEEQKQGLKPCIVVMLIQNYTPFGGFRLSNGNFSAYSYEDEIVLKEGIEMLPIHAEEYIVENKAAMFGDFNEKPVNFIYCYNKW